MKHKSINTRHKNPPNPIRKPATHPSISHAYKHGIASACTPPNPSSKLHDQFDIDIRSQLPKPNAMTRFLDNAFLFSCKPVRLYRPCRSPNMQCRKINLTIAQNHWKFMPSLTAISFVTYHIYSQGPEKNTILKTGVFVEASKSRLSSRRGIVGI